MANYWLMKSEPNCFSIQDLEACPDHTTMWDGVRNYQARNFLRDQICPGDGVLIYHSNIAEPAIVGSAKVVRGGYPDPTAFDPSQDHFDPRSNPDVPTWYVVDIQHQWTAASPLTRSTLKLHPVLSQMDLLKRGNRLSVQPVSSQCWKIICELLRNQ